MNDVINEMFAELRAQLPPLPALFSDCDARQSWMHDMRRLLWAMPTARQRAACVITLGDDLVKLRYPGMQLDMACQFLCKQFGIPYADLAALGDEDEEPTQDWYRDMADEWKIKERLGE